MTQDRPEISREKPELLQLLVEAQRGSVESEAQFFEACRGYMIAIASQELDDTLRPKVAVSDVVQESIICAQNHMEEFECRSQGELFAWLRKILRNQMSDVRRKYRQGQKRSVNREVTAKASDKPLPVDLVVDSMTPGRAAAAKEQVDQLRQAIESLSDDDRKVIALRSWEQLPFAEVGKRMDRSADAARVLWGRAVQRLGQRMKSEPVIDEQS